MGFLRSIGVCLLTLLPVIPASAGITGIVEGSVRSVRTREPLPGVGVYIPALRTGTVTDTAGRFTLPNLRIGSYEIRFSHPGYRTKRIQNVTVTSDLRTRLAVELEESDLRLDEIVVVRERPLIQTDVTATTFEVRGEDLRTLPITQPFAYLGTRPGTTLEGHVRGGKTTEVSYLVDGLPVQDVMQGGLGTLLPVSSVAGMTLHTGGFEAEYGNALSGVVNVVTRSATERAELFIRGSSDHLFGGTKDNREAHLEFTASAPIIQERLAIIGAGSGEWGGTRWWQDLKAVTGLPVEKKFSGLVKLEGTPDPSLKFGLSLLSSDRRMKQYEFPWRYNLPGLPPTHRTSHRLALSLNRTFGDRFFGTASLSWHSLRSRIGEGEKGDVPLDEPYQYDPFLRYVVSGRRTWWMDATQNVVTLKADGVLKVGESHLFKAGFELNQYRLRSDLLKLEPRTTYFGKPLFDVPQQDFSSAYSYSPRSGSLYIQDKIDLLKEGVLLSLGLRYDFLDPRAGRPAIEATVLGDSAAFQAVGPVRPASFKQQISPRVGVAMGVMENGFVFFNLGWYFQNPLFEYLYTGLDRVALAKGIPAVVGNPDLEPERASSWEASFKYILPLDLVASVCYFKKESTNLTDTKTFLPGDSKLAGGYGFAEFVNNPYAYVHGWEFIIARERGEWVTGEFSYTFMVTEGISGSAFDGYYIAQYGLPPSRRIAPLSWDQRQTIKGQVAVALPGRFTLALVGQWHSGRPYTSYPTATGFDRVDGGRFFLNNARMAPFMLLDIRAEKQLPLSADGRLVGTLFVDVRNAGDNRNVIWVDSNDRVGGELSDPSGLSIGRRIHVGLQLAL